jgi:hypothetical protein
MKFEEHDLVRMPDGREGRVLETFKDEACLVEFKTPEGESKYDNEIFMVDELNFISK